MWKELILQSSGCQTVFLSKATVRGVSTAGRVTAEPLNAHITASTSLSLTAELTHCCNIRICFWPCSPLPLGVPLCGSCVLNLVSRHSVQAVTGYCPAWSRNLLLQLLGCHGLILSCSSHWEFSTGKKLGSVLEGVDRTPLSMLRRSILLFHSLPKSVGFTVFLLFARLHETISSLCLLTPSKRAGLIPKMGVFRKSKAY